MMCNMDVQSGKIQITGKHAACPEGFDDPTSFKKRSIYYKVKKHDLPLMISLICIYF